jgi:hypothetical protein
MAKQGSITSLLVVPLIASAILLASPTAATTVNRLRDSVVRHTTSLPFSKTGVSGTVTALSGTIIKVTGRDNVLYTVDAGEATIMKSEDTSGNPSIINVTDIKVGDAIVVRGKIDYSAIDA